MFKVINGGEKLPTRATKYSAAVDLYANTDVTIGAGETKLIPLGVCIDERKFFYSMPSFLKIAKDIESRMIKGEDVGNALFEETSIFIDEFRRSHYLQLMLRSSLSKELIIANGVGVIDLDYKDEIMIRVHNPLSENVIIRYVNIILDKLGFQEAFCFKQNGSDVYIKKGQRVAQITLLEHKSYLFGIESEEERTGGFGSTGT
jgi:dUTPase